MTTPQRLAPMRRRAQLARCPRCKAPVVAGYDDNGLLTHIDPTPITRVAELQAFLAGVRTHTIDRSNGELVHRDRFRIRREAHPVFAAHSCDHPTRPDQTQPSPTQRFEPDVANPPF